MVPLGAVLDGYAEARDRVRDEALERERRRVREPPHVSVVERAVVAAILDHGTPALAACEEESLAPGDFYEERLGWIYEAARAVAERGAAVSVTSIVDRMGRAGTLGDAGGVLAVQTALERAAHWRAEDAEELLDSIVAARRDSPLLEVRTHARLLVDHARRRRVIDCCRQAVVKAQMGGQDGAAVLDETMRTLAAIEVGAAGGVVDNRAVSHELLKTLPAFGGKRDAVPTGFADLDALLQGGLGPGDLVLIAGRPSMGKTQFMLDVCERRCCDKGRPVLFFSLEMSAEQLHTRIAGARGRANPMRADSSRQMQARLTKALGEVGDAPLRIDETPGLNVAQLRARARAQKRREPIELVVVDYLQLLEAERAVDNRAVEVGGISRALKGLARELRVPVVALSQLSRGVESRADKRPLLSDLRESGALEQDADVICFLYREEYYLRDATPGNKQGVAEVSVAKHRNGPTGVISLHFGRHADDPADAPPRFGSLARGEHD